MKTILITLSVLLFLFSLLFPVFEVRHFFGTGKETYIGYQVVVSGWWVIRSGHIGWLANVTWIISICLFIKNSNRRALYFSIITVLISIDGYFLPSQWFTGFYLWNAAMLTLPLIYFFRSTVPKDQVPASSI